MQLLLNPPVFFLSLLTIFDLSYVYPHIFRQKLWFSLTVVAFKCAGILLYTHSYYYNH